MWSFRQGRYVEVQQTVAGHSVCLNTGNRKTTLTTASWLIVHPHCVTHTDFNYVRDVFPKEHSQQNAMEILVLMWVSPNVLNFMPFLVCKFLKNSYQKFCFPVPLRTLSSTCLLDQSFHLGDKVKVKKNIRLIFISLLLTSFQDTAAFSV